MDSFIFWTALYLCPVGWIILIVSNALSLSITNISICTACLVLSGTNLVGYIKCSKDHKKNILSWGQNQAMKQASKMSAADMMKVAQYANKA